MATAGALEDQELMSEGKNLSLQRCSSLKGLASRRKQRENDCEHVAEKLQRRLPKFNQFNQNGVFGREHSLEHGFRLLSAYRTQAGNKLWIITESDRSVTLLLPEEY